MRAIIFLLAIFTGCCSNQKFFATSIEGQFYQKRNPHHVLNFKNGLFSYVDTQDDRHLAIHICCDTITYGRYDQDSERGLLALSSSENINTSIVAVKVKEYIKESDSIVFIIKNPIQDYHIKSDRGASGIAYVLSVDDDHNAGLSIGTTYFNTNIIKYHAPKDTEVQRFSIYVYPKADFGGRNIGIRTVKTLDYQIVNAKSNFFEVYIPELDYGYLTYLRLKKSYVKIVTQNKLMWNGEEYLRVK